MEGISWGVLISLATFLLGWIISPIIKQTNLNATNQTRVDNICKTVEGHDRAIAEMRTLHVKDVADLKEIIADVRAKQGWQDTAEYIMGNLEKSIQNLSNIVSAWDGKLTTLMMQTVQIAGDVKLAKETADRANERLDDLEGATRSRETIGSSGR